MSERYFPKFHMSGMEDIFPKCKSYDWVKGKGNVVKTYKVENKRALAVTVFHSFMKKVLEDVIENNGAFEFPAYSASLLIEEIPPDVFISLRQQGKLKHFFTINTMGKGYSPAYRYKKYGKCFKFRVIFDNQHYNRFIELVNSGMRYFKHMKAW